jgi:CheY-like chemotaxis protein
MNKDKILFISDNGNKIANHFGGLSLKYEKTTTDLALHEWLITNLNKEEFQYIEKIVIPISLGSEDMDTGLRIGMHIRLSEELGSKRYLPLIFIDTASKKDLLFEQIDNKSDKTAILLTTPNSTLVDFDLDKIEEAITNFSQPLDNEIFKSDVLSKLIIGNPDIGGNHQLANEWGCFRLAKFAGYTLSQKLPASLFFKYHFHKTRTSLTAIPVVPTNKLGKDCKVLLIDDNAKMGWQEIIEHIQLTQVTSGNVTIDSIETEADFHTKTVTDLLQYDVIYLDLRLYKGENHAKIEDYSGAKILKKIKSLNRGIQVIILTASNKAWNMEYLISEGADGYYIKESPEVMVSDEFSKENFENLVSTSKKCIERQYLKECFTKHQSIKAKIDTELSASSICTEKKEFLEEIRVYNEMSFDLLYNASNEIDAEKKKNKFGFAYLSLFKILERINKYFIKIEPNTSVNNYYFQPDIAVHGAISTQNYCTSSINKDFLKEFGAIAWISIDKILPAINSQPFIRSLYWAVLRRNKFIHADSTLVGEAQLERDKIYNADGYKEFIDILEQIIINVP